MTTEKVNDLELVKLSDYFTPGKFRTIPGTAMTDRGGITEMQAVFNINTDFAKRLTFQFSTMLVIYGFGILNGLPDICSRGSGGTTVEIHE